MAFLFYKHLTKTPVDASWSFQSEGGIQVDTGTNSSVILWMRGIDQDTSNDPTRIFASGDAAYFWDPLKLTYRCFRFDGDYTSRIYTEL